MANKDARQKAIRIICEGEGHRWDDLFEYPYNDFERARILQRLNATVTRLEKVMQKDIT